MLMISFLLLKRHLKKLKLDNHIHTRTQVLTFSDNANLAQKEIVGACCPPSSFVSLLVIHKV